MSDKTDGQFITHNMWKIVMLMVHGFKPVHIKTGQIEGSKSTRSVLKYIFGKEARSLADAWDRGDDTEKMATIRQVKTVMDMFKENLRRKLS
jgi:hypothetical protein